MSKRSAGDGAGGDKKRARGDGDAAGAAAAAPEVARVCLPAPDWTADAVMPDGSFGKVSLGDYAGKWLVFFSYPLANTFVCTTEIISISNAVPTLAKMNAAAVGIAVDSVFTTHAWTKLPRQQGGIGKVAFPIASDLKHDISRKYGMLLEDAGHTCRATFIIDPAGVVRHVSMNDPPAGRSVDEILRLIEAYQHADANDVVCPAEWKPGKATIKPDPEGKLEYFGKQEA